MLTKNEETTQKFISMIEKIQNEDAEIRKTGYEDFFSSSVAYNRIVNNTFDHFLPYGLSEDERQCFDEEDILQQIRLNVMEGLQKINISKLKSQYEEAKKNNEENGFITKALCKYLIPYASSVAGYVDNISRYGFISRYYGRILNKARKEKHDASKSIKDIMECAKCSEKTARNLYFLYSTEFPSFEKMYETEEIQDFHVEDENDNNFDNVDLINEFLKTLSDKEINYLEYVFTMKGSSDKKIDVEKSFLAHLKDDNYDKDFFYLSEEELKDNPTYAEWAVNKSLSPERKMKDIRTSIKRKAKVFFDYKSYKNRNILVKRNNHQENLQKQSKLKKIENSEYDKIISNQENDLEIVHIEKCFLD